MNKPNGIIATSWFTGKPDINGRTRASEFYAIDKWLATVVANNMRGIIFHDCFDESVVSEHTSELITFVYDDGYKSSEYGIIDYRWSLYQSYFKDISCDFLFFTDCQDAYVTTDFFPLLKQGQVYVGSEPTGVFISGWCRRFFLPIFPNWKHRKVLLNPGILGGDKLTITGLLNKFTAEIARIHKHPKNKCPYSDMQAINSVLRSQYNDEQITTGGVLHSVFKKWQNRRRDVWIIHK